MSERYVEIKGNIVEALRNVYDPEMPSVSVLDLGLIYELHVTNEGQVECKHTLTSMMCPFADQICQDIEDAIKGSEGVTSVKRELVFTPPFSLDMVPEDTKIMMGWF
jgi:metal-sulfur cluster biosynthetic enzyme|tara:strand:- start:413 stop:733 length:321 start_codon:yes stop_codon:yes gene_type:complete